MYICMAVAYLIASYTDIKRREIPIWVFPSAVCLGTGIGYFTGNMPGLENVLGAVSIFVPALVLCLAGKMGGGDLIMFTATGFALGLTGVIVYAIVLMVSALLLLALAAVRISVKRRRKGAPPKKLHLLQREIAAAPLSGFAFLVTVLLDLIMRR